MGGNWKTVRVFISSTFRDMHAERDFLVRFVFPKLREELAPYCITLDDIDLRWGVLSDQDVTDVCREIIDQCRPRFICLLGGRYGFVPPGLTHSITADEVHYAVLDRAGPRDYCFFYFRDPVATDDMIEQAAGEYRDPPGSGEAEKLARLKTAIQDANFPVSLYTARWDDAQNRLTGLDELGARIRADLLWSIRAEFNLKPPPDRDVFAEEDEATEAFIAERGEKFVPGSRTGELDALTTFALSDGPARVLAVTGSPGLGKSSLLAAFAQSYRDSHAGATVIVHFTGVSRGSTSLRFLLRRLCRELASVTGTAAEPPEDTAGLTAAFHHALAAAAASRRLLIILDALNQIDPGDNAHTLHWLPDPLPPNVRLIVSSTEHPVLEALRTRRERMEEVRLQPLNEADSRQLIREYLNRFRKRMDEDQLREILAKPESRNPLYLLTALEELRTLGTYESITDRIRELPDGISALFLWILEIRLAADPGLVDGSGRPVGAQLVPRFVSLLAASRHGLTALEIMDLLDPGDPQGNVAALLRFLRPHLIRRNDLLDFSHASLREAVRARYLREASEAVRFHEELAGYFLRLADPDSDLTWAGGHPRPFGELLYHVLQSRDIDRMMSIARSPFLERKAALLGDAEALADARDMAVLAAEAGGSSWEDLILCARRYCDFAEKFKVSPETLLNLVRRGDTGRVQAVLDSEIQKERKAKLILAAAAFHFDAGRRGEALKMKAKALALLSKTPEEKSTVLTPYSLADDFLVESISAVIDGSVDHGQASNPSAADRPVPATDPASTSGGPGQAAPRKTVPLLHALLANFASIKNTLAMSFGWYGLIGLLAFAILLFKSGDVLAIRSFLEVNLGYAADLILLGLIVCPFLFWGAANAVPLIPLFRRRTENDLDALLGAVAAAQGPQKLRLFYRTLRYSRVVKNQSNLARLAQEAAELLRYFRGDHRRAARLIAESTSLGAEIPDRLAPVLGECSGEDLAALFTELAGMPGRAANPWQVFRLYLATMRISFDPNLLRAFITTDTDSINPDEQLPQEAKARLMALTATDLGRTLIAGLRPRESRRSLGFHIREVLSRFVFPHNQSLSNPLHWAEPALWFFLYLPWNVTFLLGTPLLGLSVAAMILTSKLFAFAYRRYRPEFSLSGNPAILIGNIMHDLRLNRIHETLLDRGRLRDTLLAAGILSSAQIGSDALMGIPERRLGLIMKRLCRGRFLMGRADVVLAVMGNRRLLDIAAEMDPVPESAGSNRVMDPDVLSEQLRRVLPLRSYSRNFLLVFGLGALGFGAWYGMAGLLNPQFFTYFWGTAGLLAGIALTGYFAAVQYSPPLKKTSEKPGSTFKGLSSWVLLFIAVICVTKLVPKSADRVILVGVGLIAVTVLISNFLVPVFISLWRGSTLLFPEKRQIWRQRLVALFFLGGGCGLLALGTILVMWF